MSFSQLILIFKARYKVLLSTIAIAIAIAIAINILLPNSYTASTSMLVNYKGVDPVTGMAVPAQLLPGYMGTQVDIITSKKIAKKVVTTLRLAESAEVIESFNTSTGGEGDIVEWLADLLLKKIEVRPARNSSVLQLDFDGANPKFAAVIANTFAEEYIKASIELKVEPSRKAAEYFTSQLKELRADVSRAQQKLSDYQQDKSIVSVDERLDIERAKLGELSSQLVIAQAQTLEAQSRQHGAQGTNPYDSPDVANNPMVLHLKTELSKSESRFADISQKFERNHPIYQGAKAEIDNLKAELTKQIQAATVNISSNYKILKQREAEIRSALNDQKTKVMLLNKDRDELAVLTREVESAQRAYELATQRYTQINLEGQSNQADVSILNPATPPLNPSSPKKFLNVAVALVLGTILGLLFSLLAELANERVRSERVLVEIVGAPLLGVIDKNKSHSKIQRLLAKKS
ncbi:chain length determinant protein EpsF [Methylobacillus flagellatus]|uniref:chain length determinant protein EpsF n=1 Tax=Methylobacillus flagellatus TaxID=405 RepID=UPI002853ECB0|nr:chain length determinant protein EpsF [Methylobacillus flagellatus]MDR5172648.1 chain length determinant protein EpsF [Methylobacillus flagellatus]